MTKNKLSINFPTKMEAEDYSFFTTKRNSYYPKLLWTLRKFYN